MTRALALALLLSSPCWAAAQSPGAAAIKKAESFDESDLRLALSLSALGVFCR